MDHRNKSLIAALLGLFSIGVQAGYAQSVPPPGWSSATSPTSRSMYRAAANEAWGAANTVRTTTALNVGGRAVTIPATMRMAANAGQFAARFAWGGPGAMAAMILIPLAIDYFADQGFTWDSVLSKWRKKGPGDFCASECYEYSVNGTANSWRTSPSGAANAYYTSSGNPTLSYSVGSCSPWSGGSSVCNVVVSGYSNGQVVNTSITVSNRRSIPPYDNRLDVDATKAEMEASAAGTPMPSGLPDALPKSIEWPVEDPVLNPSPAGQPQPQRVPQGQPQPVPNTNPQQYRQPVIDVVPAPVPSTPWQFDLQPKDVVSEDPNGLEEPEPVPVDEPDTGVEPSEKDDLCALHPEILACQELDQPDDQDLTTRSPDISIVKDLGWGAEDASCPPPRQLTVQGRSIPIPFDLVCQFMSGIRPVIISVGWLIAAMLLVGAVRSSD